MDSKIIDVDDYELALRLHRELNGDQPFQPQIGEGESQLSAYFQSINNNHEQKYSETLRMNGAAANSSNQNEVTFDNQQAITVSLKNISLNPSKYFLFMFVHRSRK